MEHRRRSNFEGFIDHGEDVGGGGGEGEGGGGTGHDPLIVTDFITTVDPTEILVFDPTFFQVIPFGVAAAITFTGGPQSYAELIVADGICNPPELVYDDPSQCDIIMSNCLPCQV